MSSLVLDDIELVECLATVERERAKALSQSNSKSFIATSDVPTISLRAWAANGCGRIVVGIGGFPASGKTTMAKQMVLAINDYRGSGFSTDLPMDGFHFRNSTLKAKGLNDVKGDITTYDVGALVCKLLELKRGLGSTIYVPDYIRAEHEISEDAIKVGCDIQIVCLEGIYVGYSEGRWSKVRELIDVLVYLDAPPDLCAERIISRNMAVGRDDTVIRRKLMNDFGFMTRTIAIMKNADYIVLAPESSKAVGTLG